MDAYRAQKQGYGHPLTIIMSKSWGNRQNHMGKILPQERTRNKIWDMSSKYIHLEFNELNELLLDEGLTEEIMNSMIMR